MAGVNIVFACLRCCLIFTLFSRLLFAISFNGTLAQGNPTSNNSTNTTSALSLTSNLEPTPSGHVSYTDQPDSDSSDTKGIRLGDHIASGLFLSRVPKPSSRSDGTTTNLAILGPSRTAHAINPSSDSRRTTSASPWPSLELDYSNDTVPKIKLSSSRNDSVLILSKSKLSTSTSPNITATANMSVSRNASLFGKFPSVAFTGNCWEQWNQYWDANSSLTNTTTVWSTATSSGVYTQYYYSLTTWTSYTLRTVTDWAANFPVNTYTTSAMIRGVEASTSSSALVSFLYTYTGYGTSDMWPNATITPPPCALPSRLPQCQASWESWATARYADLPHPSGCDPFDSTDLPETCSAKLSGWSASESAWELGRSAPPPPCAQVTLGASFCSGLRSSFAAAGTSSGTDNADYDGVLGMTRIYTMINGSDTWYYTWPAESTLAPGCALGCGECNLQGGTVELIFWQPAATTWVDGKFTALLDNATALVTIETLGTTLTSPTVYISFESLWARNSCSRFSRTIVDTIVPITDTAELQSLYGYGRYDGKQKTASFNFTDIYVKPVPEYIFMSQPRCASSYSAYPRGIRKGPPPLPANWTCPRTPEYEPILAIPIEVRSLDPDWVSCRAGYRGIYDPPLALTPKASIALPTMKVPSTPTTSAAPASTPKPSSAPKTSPLKGAPTTKPGKPSAPEASGQNDSPVDPGEAAVKPGSPQEPKNGDNEDPGAVSGNQGSPQSSQNGDSSASDEGTAQADDQEGFEGAVVHGSVSKQHASVDEPAAVASPTHQPVPSDARQPMNAVDVLTAASSQAEDYNAPIANDAGPERGNGGHGMVDPAQTDVHNYHQPGVGGETATLKDQSEISDPIVIPLTDGTKVTFLKSASSIIIKQGTSSTAIAISEGSGQLGGHSFSISGASNSMIIDGNDVHDLSGVRKDNPPPPASLGASAAWTYQGNAFTAFSQSGSITLLGSETSIILSAGAKATFAGQTITISTDGKTLVHEGSAVSFAASHDDNPVDMNDGTSQATWTDDGHAFAAFLRGSSLVVIAAGTTVTIPAGATATLFSQAIQNDFAGNAVIQDGVTQRLEHITRRPLTSSNVATWRTINGQNFVALRRNREIIFIGGGITSTLSQSSVATIVGRELTVLPSGIVVFDGVTKTISESSWTTGIDSQHASTWTYNHKTFVALEQNGDLLVKEGSATTLLHPGKILTIGDKTLSALPHGDITDVRNPAVTSSVFGDPEPSKVRNSPTTMEDASSGSTSAESAANLIYRKHAMSVSLAPLILSFIVSVVI